MALLGDLLASLSIHLGFEEQELLVKVVDRWCGTLLIFFFAHVEIGSDLRIIQLSIFQAAKVESSGDADSTYRIEPVGILYYHQLRRAKSFTFLQAVLVGHISSVSYTHLTLPTKA